MKYQIYDGYKPIVCRPYTDSNSMGLFRNGEFLGIVKLNSLVGGAVRMFDIDKVVINFRAGDDFYLNFNDLTIIQDSWNKMQQIKQQ
jgi:hypothetical protein